MASPVYHDEIDNLIDTYNYMTRKMDQLMEEQAKAAEELRIAEFHSLQAQINSSFSLQYNGYDQLACPAGAHRRSFQCGSEPVTFL